MQSFFDKGEDAAGACKGLMELANRRWSDMVGDYRDDITATVVRLPFLPPAAAAAAAAAAEDASEDPAEDNLTEMSATDASPPLVKSTAATTAAPAAVGAIGVSSPASAESAAAVAAGAAAAAEAAEAAGEAPWTAASGRVTLAARALHAATQTQPIGSPLRPRARSSPVGTGSVLASNRGSSIGGGGDGEGDGKSRPAVARIADGDVLREEGDEAAADDAVSALIAGEKESEGRGSAFAPVITLKGVGGEEEDEDEDEEGEEDTMKLLSSLSKALVGRTATRSASTAAVAAAAAAAAAATAAMPPPEPVVPLKAAFLPAGTDEAGNEGAGEGEGGEEGESEEWEWNFGARENREPSREMREASREFPSGSLDALVAGIDSRET